MYREQRGERMNVEEKERLIKKDIESVENRVRHAFNQGFEMGLKASSSEIPNTCGDAISRQAVLDAMYALCGTGETLKENPWRDNPHIDAITDAIDDLPSVTPQQKMGKWVDDKCSECGWEHTGDEESLTAFCPNCGARMESEE